MTMTTGRNRRQHDLGADASELREGMLLEVVFGDTQMGISVCGWWRGWKVVPDHHSYRVSLGETWQVRIMTYFDSGAGKNNLNANRGKYTESPSWGRVIYAWPVRQVG